MKFFNAELGDAFLSGAQLEHADLFGAHSRGATLNGAQLRHATLGGADLGGAHLEGADLRGAKLQYADLDGAQLQGANLAEALLSRASFNQADLGLSILLDADFTGKLLEDNELKILNSLGRVSMRDQPAEPLNFIASPKRKLLVSDPKHPPLSGIPGDWLLTEPTAAYIDAFVALWQTTSDPAIANGIASTAAAEIQHPDTRPLYAAVACRLLVGASEKTRLDQSSIDRLTEELRREQIECPSAKSAAHR